MVGWKSLVFARSISECRRALSPNDCGRSPHAEGAKKENGRFVPLFGFANGLLAFLALAVSVVKNVMAAAVEIREENDLTV